MQAVNKHIISVIIVVLFTSTISLFAQNNEAESLKKKRRKLEQEIKYTNKLLAEVSKNKKTTLYELNLLNNKITKRNELIAVLKREIYLIDKKIAQTGNSLEIIENDLKTLKKEYARIAYYLYKNNDAYNKLIFIFSAEDLNQAYQRLRYMKELSDFVKKQAEELKKKEKLKNKQLENLNKEKAEKKRLLEKQNEEIARLELAKKKKEKVKRKLQGKESKLKAQLRAKRKEAEKLKAKIENVIVKETKPVKKAGKKVTYTLTPEEIKLSKTFAANKGKLPWPLERGVISETFGVHKHPVLKHVKTKNNGIDFATSSSGKARAVFSGKVVSIVHITNTNIAVIIKHGEYFTVYSNLDEVFVDKNEYVKAKQVIGKIHTNLQGKTVLHFEVWRGKTVQNPAYWLMKK